MTGRTAPRPWSVCTGSLLGSWWTRTCSLPGMGVGEGQVQASILLAGSKEVEGERCPQATGMPFNQERWASSPSWGPAFSQKPSLSGGA